MVEGKIAVVGGAGFVGHAVLQQLVEKHGAQNIIVLDNCSRGALDNLRGLDVDVHVGDVREHAVEFLQDLGVTEVYDFAARVYGVRDLYKNPAELLSDNIAITTALLRMAVAAQVRRYVFVSSSCVYDFPTVGMPHEEDDTGICDTSYGFSKVAGEQLVRWYAAQYGFEPKIVRLFNVYGPRDSFQSPHVIPEFTRKAWKLATNQASTFPILGRGNQTRDFTWLDDAAAGIVAVAEQGAAEGAYNIGTGREVSIIDLAHMVLRAFDLDPARVEFVHEDVATEDIQRRAAWIERITTDTDWRPQVSLEDGVRRVKEWMVPLLDAGQLAG